MATHTETNQSMYPVMTKGGTGDVSPAPRRVTTLSFGQYEIVLELGEDNRVVGVVEIRVKKDFRTTQQRINSSGVLDVEEFYKD
jgi:hypothetical protein